MLNLHEQPYRLGHQTCNLNVLLSNTYHQGELAIANSWSNISIYTYIVLHIPGI
ncbi:MAG: hypothetical protein F6K10_22295 [Moorea sp. SIO2B7]|nr:hypothetical protein [Moorena sp. SIO2B7]